MRNRLGRSDVAPFPAFMEALEPRLMLNGAPVLDVPDIAMSYSQDHQDVTLTDDANVTYAVVDGTVKAAGQTAFELKTQLGLATYAPQYDGWGGSKWLQGTGGAWYALFSDGRVTSWPSGQLAGTVIPAYYADPTSLVNAVATPLPDGTVTVAAHNLLTITPPHDFLGIFSATLRATEGDVTVDDTFSVTVTNSPPVLDVADFTMPYNAADWDIALPATDADGDHVTYEVVAVSGPGQAAYELKQQLGLTTYAPQYDGWGGSKWLQGGGFVKGVLGDQSFSARQIAPQWYQIFSDGRVTNWLTRQLEGTLDTSYYTDPNTLIDAAEDPMPDGTVTVAGNLLTITPDGFLGIFSVTLSATDDTSTVTDTFSVTVANSLPVIDIDNVVMSQNTDQNQALPATDVDTDGLVGGDHGLHFRNLTLPATDADGDHVTYLVLAVNGPDQAAYELKQQLGLTTYAPQYDGWAGAKWLQGAGGAWYKIFSDGRVTSWWTGQLEGMLDPSYYTDPNTLINAAEDLMPDGTVTVNGNVLTITPPAGFLGTFSTTLSATDDHDTSTGMGIFNGDDASTVTGSFTTTVTINAPPVLDVDDVITMPHNTHRDLTLPATDADGTGVTYLVVAVNGSEQAAYELKTQLGLTTYTPQYDGWAGSKWLQDAGGAWYQIFSDGRVTDWRTGQLEGTVDPSYYTDPNTLIDADEDAMPDGTVTVAGNLLTITPPTDFLGNFSATLSATDGVSTVTGTFTVAVVDAVAPTVAITPVAPDLRNIAVASVGIVFSESVAGFDLADLSLTRNGDAVSLAAATLTSTDNMLWTLGNLAGVTGTAGAYVLTLNASDAEISAAVGHELPLTTGASDTWTMDITAPTVAITAITPDPRTTAAASATIVFSEAVTGFGLADLGLTLDDEAVLLTDATLESADNITWTLGNLTDLTGTAGTYVLTLTAAGSGITDAATNALAANGTDTWVKTAS
ncbi:MAG: LEPR-XLL domain-containing protein [Planctomycetota bacterium]|nr:LEPR-XLL domain-containing protein [Planctomycetota bacterium]